MLTITEKNLSIDTNEQDLGDTIRLIGIGLSGIYGFPISLEQEEACYKCKEAEDKLSKSFESGALRDYLTGKGLDPELVEEIVNEWN